jgi:hypothetical protein
LDALTKVLVGLYEEPDRSQINALEYVKKYLGAPTGMDMEGLRRENEELKRQLEKMKTTTTQPPPPSSTKLSQSPLDSVKK